jgi:hypothetical protein
VANEAQPSAQWPDQGNDTSKPAPPAASKAEGLSDPELVRRVRDADGAALSQLSQRFVRPCYSLARPARGGRSEAGKDWSPTPVPGADQVALARIAAGQLRAALHRLPAAQRQVLALAYFGGHT